jgi:hypothetical protein
VTTDLDAVGERGEVAGLELAEARAVLRLRREVLALVLDGADRDLDGLTGTTL